MKVLLRRNFFSATHGRFRKGPSKKTPVEMPDELRDRLPSDAVIVGEEQVEEPEEAPQEPQTFSEMTKRYAGDNPDPQAVAAAPRNEKAEKLRKEIEREKKGPGRGAGGKFAKRS